MAFPSFDDDQFLAYARAQRDSEPRARKARRYRAVLVLVLAAVALAIAANWAALLAQLAAVAELASWR
jgi:hypothetical protein